MNDKLALVSHQLLWTRENMPKLYLGACLMAVQPFQGELHTSDQCFVCYADSKLMMEIIMPFKAREEKRKDGKFLNGECSGDEENSIDLNYPFSNPESARQYLKSTGAPHLDEALLAKDSEWQGFLQEAITFFSRFEVVKDATVASSDAGTDLHCQFCVARFGFDSLCKDGHGRVHLYNAHEFPLFGGFCLHIYQEQLQRPASTQIPPPAPSIARSRVKAPLKKSVLCENSNTVVTSSVVTSAADEGCKDENGGGCCEVDAGARMDVDDDGAKITVPEIGSPVKALRLLCPTGPSVAASSKQPIRCPGVGGSGPKAAGGGKIPLSFSSPAPGRPGDSSTPMQVASSLPQKQAVATADAATQAPDKTPFPKLLTHEDVDRHALCMPTNYRPHMNRWRSIASFQSAGEIYNKQVLRLKNTKRGKWIFKQYNCIEPVGVIPYVFSEKQRLAQRQWDQGMKKHIEKLVWGGSARTQSSKQNRINSCQRIVQSVAWDQQAVKKKCNACAKAIRKLRKLAQKADKAGRKELEREMMTIERDEEALKAKLAVLKTKREKALQELYAAEASYKNQTAGDGGNGEVNVDTSPCSAPSEVAEAAASEPIIKKPAAPEPIIKKSIIKKPIIKKPDRHKILKWTKDETGAPIPIHVAGRAAVDQVVATKAVSGPAAAYDANSELLQCLAARRNRRPILSREQEEFLELAHELAMVEHDIYYYNNPQPYVDSDSRSDDSLEFPGKPLPEFIPETVARDPAIYGNCSTADGPVQRKYQVGRKKRGPGRPRSKAGRPRKKTGGEKGGGSASRSSVKRKNEAASQQAKKQATETDFLQPGVRPLVKSKRRRTTRLQVVAPTGGGSGSGVGGRNDSGVVGTMVAELRTLSAANPTGRSTHDNDNALSAAFSSDDSSASTEFRGWVGVASTRRRTEAGEKKRKAAQLVQKARGSEAKRRITNLTGKNIMSLINATKSGHEEEVVETRFSGDDGGGGGLTSQQCMDALSGPLYRFADDDITFVPINDNKTSLSDTDLETLYGHVMLYLRKLYDCQDLAEDPHAGRKTRWAGERRRAGRRPSMARRCQTKRRRHDGAEPIASTPAATEPPNQLHVLPPKQSTGMLMAEAAPNASRNNTHLQQVSATV